MTAALERIRDLIQEDVGGRGLRTDPHSNLITACAHDFAGACRSLAEHSRPTVGIVTGFYIPTGEPPAGETDGPLGASFLARALVQLDIRPVLITDDFCVRALEAGVSACCLREQVRIVVLPACQDAVVMGPWRYWRHVAEKAGLLTHLIALERVGPSHTLQSLQAQSGSQGALGETYLEFLHTMPPERQDRCHTMRGRDITDMMSPAHWLFESAAEQGIVTIGIGDGGNEIGMGKIPWHIIDRNIPGGGLVACRVPTDYLVVCGISNWGAYGLATGVSLLRRRPLDPAFFDRARECHLLREMVRRGPLVDGVTGQPTLTVDGLAFDRYSEVLQKLSAIC